MEMNIKFRIESNRVKGICFHSKNPWVLVSLHDGAIYIYNYLYHCEIKAFVEHSGPVRGIDFHPTKDIFVSGGDDRIIKVWDYITGKKCFELLGHTDYVRTVKFHSEHPWVLSSSDDQTARIWNWQSRQCLSVLSGHNHYVMCAQFHPSEPLVLTASLDETVRIWDISALQSPKTKKSQPQNFFDVHQDIFGTNGVFSKMTLEGHTRGINWASFCPNDSLIATASDDFEVKIFRYNDSKAWEIDSKIDHINNVSCVLFDPQNPNFLASNAEDKSIMFWNRKTDEAILKYVEETDVRFWVLAAHPFNNLYAAGHDKGFFVFSVKPEFPVCGVANKKVYFLGENGVESLPLNEKGDEQDYTTFPKQDLDNAYEELRVRKYDEEGDIVIGIKSEKTKYKFEVLKGTQVLQSNECIDVDFLSRNKLILLDEDWSTKKNYLIVMNYKGHARKKIPLKQQNVLRVFATDGGAKVAIVSKNSLSIFDPVRSSEIAHTEGRNEKTNFVKWGSKSTVLALVKRRKIIFYGKDLSKLGTVSETNLQIKSGLWDISGAFLYSTDESIKYSLINGETGIVCNTEKPVYLLKAFKNGDILMSNTEGKLLRVKLRREEIEFKNAVELNQSDKVADVVSEGSINGHNMARFLLRKKHARAALSFSADPETRFELAIVCGELDAAEDCLRQSKKTEWWSRLAEKAIKLKAFKKAENALVNGREFLKLGLLYLLSGQREKLEKLLAFTLKMGRKDVALTFSMYIGDLESRVKLLKEAGLEKLAEASLNAYDSKNANENDQIKTEFLSLPLVVKDSLENWPRPKENENKPNSEMERILRTISAKTLPAKVDLSESFKNAGLHTINDDFDEFQDWMIGMENSIVEETSSVPSETAKSLQNKNGEDKKGQDKQHDLVYSEKIEIPKEVLRTSSILNLVAEKRFGVASERLFRRFGIGNVDRLKPFWVESLCLVRAEVPLLPGTENIETPLIIESENKQFTLAITRIFSLENCQKLFEKAMSNVTAKKLEEAQSIIHRIFQILPHLVLRNRNELDKAKETLGFCVNYTLAIKCSVELSKVSSPKRKVELACYWTQFSLRPLHTFLGQLQAIKIAKENQFEALNKQLCVRCADLGMTIKVAPAIQRTFEAIKSAAEVNKWPIDSGAAKEVDVDFRENLVLDCSELRPLRGEDLARSKKCSFCGAKRRTDIEGKFCAVCVLGLVGGPPAEGFLLEQSECE